MAGPLTDAPDPHPPLRARIRAALQATGSPSGLFLAAVLLLAALPVTSPIRDPDFWWHLRTGQLILDRHALLGTDPFTYTVPQNHWVMHEWLTEVMFAGLHHLGGIALVVIVLSLATWAGILLVAARAAARHPARGVLALAVLLGVLSGYPIWGPRAQMETFAFTCLVVWLVDRHLRVGGRAVWWLVPIMLVWSNLHSGFVIGIGFIVVMLGAEWLEGRLGRAAASGARLWGAARALGVCLLVVAINPNGPAIYLYPLETQTSGAQQSLIQEWHSPDFHLTELHAFELMLVSLAVMLVVNRRVRLPDLALVLGTSALALQSTRHIALFVAVSTPVWAWQAQLTWERIRPALTRTRRTRTNAVTPAAPRGFQLLSWGVLGLLALMAVSRGALAAADPEDSLATAQAFPVCATRWLAASPTPLTIFNQYGEGGYLAYRLSARGDKVFIFGDAALMGDAMLLRYGDAETLAADWADVVSNRGGTATDVVLFDTGTPLAHLLESSPRWQRVYSDPRSEVFVPRMAATSAATSRLAGLQVDTGAVCRTLQRVGIGTP